MELSEIDIDVTPSVGSEGFVSGQNQVFLAQLDGFQSMTRARLLESRLTLTQDKTLTDLKHNFFLFRNVFRL